MSVIYLSGDGTVTDMVQCNICRKYLPLTKLSVGIYDTQHNQTFFCDAHYLNMTLVIVRLADYMAIAHRTPALDVLEDLYGR